MQKNFRFFRKRKGTPSTRKRRVTTTHAENFNLPEPHKELLRWHYHLGHIGLRTIQFIMQTRALATSHAMKQLHKHTANIPLHDMPKCAGFQFGKQTSQAVPGR